MTGDLYARTIEMGNNGDQSQLVEQVEHVIRQVQKTRLLQDPGAVSFYLPPSPAHHLEVSEPGDESVVEDFFDWALWGNNDVDEVHSGTKSESPSMPGLTSATTPPGSEKAGAVSPPSEREDRSKLKDKLKEAKRTDDRYTFPQRELRPKEGPGYTPQLSLNNPSHHGPPIRSSGQDFNVENALLSPPSSPGSKTDADGPVNHHQLIRGKRIGPLKNGDEVAEVRARGACVCCRLRRVKVCITSSDFLERV
jgi:hypothetical protein